MMRQLSLIDSFSAAERTPPIVFADHRLADGAKPRLSRQCQAILERLKEGPANNKELAGIALKYTGRLSDLRKSGFQIEAFDHNHSSGECWYRLKTTPGRSVPVREADHAPLVEGRPGARHEGTTPGGG